MPCSFWIFKKQKINIKLQFRKKLLKIYEKRGNNAALVKDVMYNFDNWSRNQKDYSYSIVVLDKDKYLEDLLLEKGLINNS